MEFEDIVQGKQDAKSVIYGFHTKDVILEMGNLQLKILLDGFVIVAITE